MSDDATPRTGPDDSGAAAQGPSDEPAKSRGKRVAEVGAGMIALGIILPLFLGLPGHLADVLVIAGVVVGVVGLSMKRREA